MKTLRTIIFALGLGIVLAACSSPPSADVASYNLSDLADNFELERRVVFFNGITDTYLLEIEGRCSIEHDGLDDQLEVVCLIGQDEDGEFLFVKHFLGLSDNVTYFVEQTSAESVSTFHYTVRFRPETILPNIVIDTSVGDAELTVPEGGD